MAEVSAGSIRCSKRHPTPDHCLPQSKANLHLCMRVVRSAGRQGAEPNMGEEEKAAAMN